MITTFIELRPQPLGVFPLPAGLLLLPALANREALEHLMRGDSSIPFPPEWRFFQLTLEGSFDEALACIRGDDPIARHNRLVLGEAPTPTRPDGEFQILHDAALYASGRSEQPPTPESLDAELLAFVLMLQATRSIEQSDFDTAISILEQAIAAARPVSPEFAAQLIGQIAAIRSDSQPAEATALYRKAISIAQGPCKADLALQLGITLQDASRGNHPQLLEAVKAYQDALLYGISLEKQPESFALLQSNLARAHLSMPKSESGDQIRMGIAVQSLREALKVYTKTSHPEQWASAQLNLANALQYMSSPDTKENLKRAVEIYDEILSLRRMPDDPVGYARLLANQANALAHLGSLARAMERVSEALQLFERHKESEMAASARNLRESIAEQQGKPNGPA